MKNWIPTLLLAAASGAAQAQAHVPGQAPGQDPALEQVALQLKWKHQFQFAGYYAAAARGYYREAGFEVRLAESTGEDSIATVLRGGAAYGVAGSEVALRRALGEPVVALATVLQHSALALAVRGAGLSVHDLDGKSIMISSHEAELFAYLRREGLPSERVRRVPQSFDIQDLVKGRVDAFSIYSTDQALLLRRQGVPHTVLSPRSAGIDFYGDTLFTSDERARREPARVAAFRDASLRGWRYAMEQPAEIADLILAQYSRRNTREHLLAEAEEMRRLMQPELIEIGHMNPGRWQHIAEIYADMGMLPRSHSLEGFLFETNPRADVRHLYGWLAAAAGAVLLAGLLAAWQARRNRELRRAIEGRDEAEAHLRETNAKLHAHLQEIRALQLALEEQSIRDPLTGLYNRRYLEESLARELARAERQKFAVALLVLDVDRFRALNDRHGHPGGDAVLKALAAVLGNGVREGDLACRSGGAEFVVMLHAADIDGARQRAETLRAAFKAMRIRVGEVEVSATISVGAAAFPVYAANAPDLLRAATDAMYEAKRRGRDRVCVADEAEA